MKLNKLQKELLNIDSNITASIKDGCIKLDGEVDNYLKAVKAGQLAVDKERYLGVLNDIKVKGFTQKVKVPTINDNSLDGENVDVLIVGGGVAGCATLRELSKYNLNVLLVERGADVGVGQSSRNGGVLHVGLNFSKSSQKFQYCVRGNSMYEQLSKELSVPFEQKGQVTFAHKKWEMLLLKAYTKIGEKKGIPNLKVMGRDELLKYEPSVPEWSLGGLLMGTGGITCPYKMVIALAENAIENGGRVSLNTAVLDMEVKDGKVVKVITNRGAIYPKTVVNAAGVFADYIAEMAKDRTFTIHPRTGTDLITDKKIGYMVNSSMGKTPFTLSPKQLESIPNSAIAKIKAIIKNLHSHSKGVGLIHSVDGNMLVGPNADEVLDREDLSTTRDVVNNIINVQREVQPNFHASDVIAYFTGIRASTYEEDFVVRKGIMTKNIFEAAGIQSPGLTAAPAIAEDLSKWIVEYLNETGNKVQENKSFNPIRQHVVPSLKEMSLEDRDELIKKNSNYGEIICRCEEISKGEILDALNSPLKVETVDAVKKRCRPGMGRCQGGFCLPLVMKIIAEERGCEIEEVKKSTEESLYILSNTK